MAVSEILMTKKECFTIFEDGHIIMQKGKYTPTKAPLHDVHPMPKEPEKGAFDVVQRNIWGEEIYKKNEAVRNWQLECRNIEEMNALARQGQEREFKRHLIDVRRAYYRQEKQSKKEALKKEKEFRTRQKMGARAYLKTLLQR